MHGFKYDGIAPDSAHVRALCWAMPAQILFVCVSPANGTQPLRASFPTAFLGANLLLVVLKALGLYI